MGNFSSLGSLFDAAELARDHRRSTPSRRRRGTSTLRPLVDVVVVAEPPRPRRGRAMVQGTTGHRHRPGRPQSHRHQPAADAQDCSADSDEPGLRLGGQPEHPVRPVQPRLRPADTAAISTPNEFQRFCKPRNVAHLPLGRVREVRRAVRPACSRTIRRGVADRQSGRLRPDQRLRGHLGTSTAFPIDDTVPDDPVIDNLL